jgi:hypothetical protein
MISVDCKSLYLPSNNISRISEILRNGADIITRQVKGLAIYRDHLMPYGWVFYYSLLTRLISPLDGQAGISLTENGRYHYQQVFPNMHLFHWKWLCCNNVDDWYQVCATERLLYKLWWRSHQTKGFSLRCQITQEGSEDTEKDDTKYNINYADCHSYILFSNLNEKICQHFYYILY